MTRAKPFRLKEEWKKLEARISQLASGLERLERVSRTSEAPKSKPLLVHELFIHEVRRSVIPGRSSALLSVEGAPGTFRLNSGGSFTITRDFALHYGPGGAVEPGTIPNTRTRILVSRVQGGVVTLRVPETSIEFRGRKYDRIEIAVPILDLVLGTPTFRQISDKAKV